MNWDAIRKYFWSIFSWVFLPAKTTFVTHFLLSESFSLSVFYGDPRKILCTRYYLLVCTRLKNNRLPGLWSSVFFCFYLWFKLRSSEILKTYGSWVCKSRAASIKLNFNLSLILHVCAHNAWCPSRWVWCWQISGGIL